MCAFAEKLSFHTRTFNEPRQLAGKLMFFSLTETFRVFFSRKYNIKFTIVSNSEDSENDTAHTFSLMRVE